MVVAYVIYFVRRDRQAVLACQPFGSVSHHSCHTFHNVIYVGEVPLAVPVIEDPDGIAFHQFIGEAEANCLSKVSKDTFTRMLGKSGFLHLPISDGLLFLVETDAYFHYRQAAESKAFGVLLQVYLTKGGVGVLVQLQLYDV